jgi:hypothetical protein
MSQTVKANKTLNKLKWASAALATVLKLLARFFTQLGSWFAGWPTVSQRPQCGFEHLAQKEDGNREAQETRIWEDEQALIRERDERREREAQETRNREDEQALIRERDERRERGAQETRNREDERLNHEFAARLIRERAKTLNRADAARVAWENELQRSQHNRGLDGPSIER